MAINVTENSKEKLILELNNGDKDKLQQLLTEWKFKDIQSLLRFAMSAMLLTKDKTLTITTDEGNEKIMPVDTSLNK